MIKAGIVGGTGYTGVELLRLLAAHPSVELAVITSRGEKGVKVSELFPNLRGRVDLAFVEPDGVVLKGCDVVFFATPNGTAMQSVPALLKAGVKIIDLAADFRLRQAEEWEQWYGIPHICPELLTEAVYGLPEVNREAIRSARLVANPGCYPTAVQLGFLPLLEAGVVDPQSLIADAKSGVSGAGRKAEIGFLLCEVGDNFKAYNVPAHRHLPEIRQGLTAVAGGSVELIFTPHLIPMIRGIHATLYATLTDSQVDLQALFEQRYAAEPFVDVLPPKSHPETRAVRGSNQCRLAVHRPQNGKTVVVLSVIDNLVKGAAGQAVQNMNLMFGLPEGTGLEGIALLP
ncbi:MAG: N-acetyl-gamma-glutamyl-phosphate reductase [Gammaproteobacteria bacterium]|nr:N-acetyl-gamma-glutamyl-phosphate reductase [Gammaproteobacteria bacterium]MCP5195308.1 N-acetyl-gamma-glutamyl-phosphate reductase [Gammaproteobacteria bacterium]